ncbi:MAG: hypothetical protein ACFFEK_00230 [Candidatus Thorarchaeota archaeon]
MTTFSELKSKCERALASPILDESEESITVLCQNDWVRILTVYDSESTGKWRIEVEVSLPSKRNPQSEEDVRSFVQNLIQHLEYLLHLNSGGFSLSVMSRDGLWTAFRDIDDLPQDSLFKTLVPPIV